MFNRVSDIHGLVPRLHWDPDGAPVSEGPAFPGSGIDSYSFVCLKVVGL